MANTAVPIASNERMVVNIISSLFP
jgi:hypothetical protein